MKRYISVVLLAIVIVYLASERQAPAPTVAATTTEARRAHDPESRGVPQGQKVSPREDERLCPVPCGLGFRYQSWKCQVEPGSTVAGPAPRGPAW